MQTSATSYKDKWIIFIGAGLLVLLINLDTTIVNLALPVIGHEFLIPLSTLKWVINIYLISGASLFLLSGRLSEVLGHRMIFLIGVVFFCVGSLMGGFANHWTFLLLARIIQGIGFACTLSQALNLIAESFPKGQQGFAIGLSVIITGIGQALGPTIGGFILDMLNWHWIFLVNVPFCIVSFLIILIYCKESHQKLSLKTLDLINSGLFIAALVCFMVAVSIFDSTSVIVPAELMIASFILLTLFYYKNIRSKNPVFDFKLFKIAAYNSTLIIRFTFVVIWLSLLLSLPLYLQNILLYSPWQSGLILLAMTILMTIVSPLAGRLSDRIGVRVPMQVGLISCMISLILLSIPVIQSNLFFLILSLLPFGFSSGILIPMTIMGIMNNIPLERKGTALGLLFTLTFVGGTVGTSMMSLILSHVSWYQFQKLCALNQIQIPTTLMQNDLKSIVSGAISISRVTESGLSQIEIQQIVPLIQHSFGFAFSVGLILCLLFIPFLLRLTRNYS